jgi:hypothetical protein
MPSAPSKLLLASFALLVILMLSINMMKSASDVESDAAVGNIRPHFEEFDPRIPKHLLTPPSDFKYNHTFQHAYSLWFQPPKAIADVHRREAEWLADQFHTPKHIPHVTIYGAVYTTDTNYVISVAKDIAKEFGRLGPMKLIPRRVQVNANLNITKRWRSSISIRYQHGDVLMKALSYAALVFGDPKSQHPHSSVIYDYLGTCTIVPGLNETIWRHLSQGDGQVDAISWIPDAVHVAYTPLRPHFISNYDMTTLVQDWKLVASIPIEYSTATGLRRGH